MALLSAGIAAAVPGAADAGVIWTGDAEQPAALQWASSSAGGAACNAAPPNMTTASVQRVTFPSPVAQGKYSYHFQIADGDNCFGARAELGQGNPPNPHRPTRYFYPGQDRWISFQAYFPDDYQLGAPLGESSGLLQIKQEGADGQPALGIGNGEGYLCLYLSSMFFAHFSSHCGGGYYDLGRPAKDTWIKLTLQVGFSTTDQGFVQVWGDLGDGKGYRPLLGRVDAPTMKAYPNGTAIPSQARIGLYRSLSLHGTEDLYVDGFTVATDEASANANAFAPPSSSVPAARKAPVMLKVGHVKHRPRWLHVHGRIRASIRQAVGVQRWLVLVGERVRGHWRLAASGKTAPRGTFSLMMPVPRSRNHTLVLRAWVIGVGDSNTAVVRLR